MSDCHNKIKNTCGNTTYATCVKYETTLPEFSKIISCPTIEETTEELYRELEEYKDENDLSLLGERCLTYTKKNNRNIVKNILLEYEKQICTLKQEIEDFKTKGLCDMSIVDCGLPLDNIVTDSAAKPATLGELLKILINK